MEAWIIAAAIVVAAFIVVDALASLRRASQNIAERLLDIHRDLQSRNK